MKLKCTKTYYDKEKKVYVEVNKEFEAEKERAEELINHGVAQMVEEKPKEKQKEQNKGNAGAIK